ncbi:MAG TPA: sulfatase-like hydrolase/transferase, partial [Bacteroidales bacterium]|nr:sulfatase-like hydrolase/transferase [Bacteroidales bacterium]
MQIAAVYNHLLHKLGLNNKFAGKFMKHKEMNGIKAASIYLLKLFVFWMALFYAFQCLFLAFNFRMLADIPLGHTMYSFLKALPMNVASACYLLLPSLIVLCIGISSKNSTKFFHAARWINWLLIVFYLLISLAGLGLYANWGTKINSKALSFMIYPQEVAGILFDIYNLLYFGILVAITALIFLVYRHFFKTPATRNTGIVRSSIFFVIITGILFVGARGGVQKYPISKQSCFYSKYPVLNFAALNDFWNFSATLVHPRMKENPYVFYSKSKAEKVISDLFAIEKDSTEYLLKTSRPNIVLIALESFSADAIACLGGEKGITPCFDSLAKEGFLFTRAYATGFR